MSDTESPRIMQRENCSPVPDFTSLRTLVSCRAPRLNLESKERSRDRWLLCNCRWVRELIYGRCVNCRIGVLFPTRETSEYYARLFAQLRKAGTPIPTNDLWIASLAVQHELTLLSRDDHFDKLPQLLRA